MARVIRHGNSYEKLWKATCPRCKCFFEYGESDYLPVYPVLQREAMEHNIYIKCPECGYTIEKGKDYSYLSY